MNLGTMIGASILQAALKLPSRERADLAADLLASLDDELIEDRQGLERAWASEIERRARRVLAGESSATPWEQVKQRIERRLAK